MKCQQPLEHSSIIGAKSNEGFELVVKHLIDNSMIIGNDSPVIYDGAKYWNITLSFNAWDYYEDLIRGKSNYRKAFIAMKFGDDCLDKMVKNVFKPSAKEAGFDLIKLNDEPKAGLIDDRLRVEIQSSQFLIADLSHDNAGAYWEAGYAEGLGKPVIYTCNKDKFKNDKTHFDTNHHFTILWDSKDSIRAGEDLKATIRASFPGIAKLED